MERGGTGRDLPHRVLVKAIVLKTVKLARHIKWGINISNIMSLGREREQIGSQKNKLLLLLSVVGRVLGLPKAAVTHHQNKSFKRLELPG